MFKYIITAIVILSLMPLSASSGSSGTTLNGKEIKALVSGNTAEGHRLKQGKGMDIFVQKKIMFRTYFAANGKIVEKTDASGKDSVGHIAAHGKWTLKKKKLCVTYADSRDTPGKKRCYKVTSKNNGTYELYLKDTLNRTWDRVVPGNPHGLE